MALDFTSLIPTEEEETLPEEIMSSGRLDFTSLIPTGEGVPPEETTTQGRLDFTSLIPKEEPPKEPKPPSKYQSVGGTLKRLGEDVYIGQRQLATDFYNTLANIPGLLNRIETKIFENMGFEGIEPNFKAAEDALRKLAENVSVKPEELKDRDTLIDKAYMIVGQTPGTILEYAIPSKKLGAVAGMALVDALRESDKGAINTALAAAKGALMGGMLKASEPLTRPLRTVAMGTAGAVAAAAEGAKPEDIALGGLTMAGLGALGERGRLNFKDLIPKGAEKVELKPRFKESYEEYVARTKPAEKVTPAPPEVKPVTPEPPAMVTPEQITFSEELTGAYKGQKNITLTAKINDKVVGTLEYSEFEKKPHINFVEVLPEYRRQGVGAGLVKKLQEEYPDKKIEWGMTTPEGTALKTSIAVMPKAGVGKPKEPAMMTKEGEALVKSAMGREAPKELSEIAKMTDGFEVSEDGQQVSFVYKRNRNPQGIQQEIEKRGWKVTNITKPRTISKQLATSRDTGNDYGVITAEKPPSRQEQVGKAKEVIPEPLKKLLPDVAYEKGRFLEERAMRLSKEEKKEIINWAIKNKESVVYEPQSETKAIMRLAEKYAKSATAGELKKEGLFTPEQKERQLELKKEPQTEPEFLEESPNIGASVKQIKPVSIRIEKEPKDLVGLSGWFQNWMSPARHIAEQDPIANKIAHYGRDTLTGLSNEQSHYSERIDKAFKGLNTKEKELVIDYLEGKYPLETMPAKFKTAYTESDSIRQEMYKTIQEDIGKDVSNWGIKPEEYFPHIFVGSYQIRDGARTIEGGFARNLSEAVDKAVTYLKTKPNADINIAPKDIGGDYTATLLSRKGFWRFITEVKKATALDKEEIMSMMKGVAAIKPRGKFVGNFLQRSVNLGGYMKDPLALKIYTNRILRKKWIDPFRKQATDWATQLEPGYKEYFEDYIDDVSGKYNPIDNKFLISKWSGKITGAQSELKLGYRPITALVNRLQPMQTAYSEIGTYLFQGSKFKNTVEGKKVLTDSGIGGQVPKYYAGEFLAKSKEEIYKPLGMFSKAEMANRGDVVAGGYLFAKKVFQMPVEKAEKMGYGYILEYLKQHKDPYKAALEYAKDLNADTNYIYDASDAPKLLRKPFGRVALQFKTFPINFTAQSIKWLTETFTKPSLHNTARFIRFAGANISLGGVRTIPYIGRNLWKGILLSPVIAALLPEDNEIAKKTKQVIGRGIFSLLGIDLSQRLGPNEFLPRTIKDLAGPVGGDLYILYKYFRGDITLGQAITQPVGAIRDVYRAIRESEYIADPNKRWRKIAETTGWDKFLQAIGSPVLKVEVTRDLQVIISELVNEYKRKKARYVDEIIARKEQKKSYGDILAKAREEGIKIDWKDIREEAKKKEEPALERRMETVPKDLRKEVRELIEAGQ